MHRVIALYLCRKLVSLLYLVHFLADCLQTLYMSWYLGGMVWDCRWIDLVKLAQSYCPWFVWKMGFCALSRSFFGRLSSNFVLIRSGWRHNRYIVSNARNKNSELLAFYRHDFIIFNHFPKVLIDPKSKTRGEKSQTMENNSFCKALFWFTWEILYYGKIKAEIWHLSEIKTEASTSNSCH